MGQKEAIMSEKKELIVVTDSVSDITPEIAQKYDIEIIPYYVHIKGTSYKEGEITPEQFYKYLESAKEFPTTSHPNLGEFARFFENIAKKAKEIIFLSLSASYSKGFEIACKAAESLKDIKIHLIDTKAAIGKQALIAIEVAKKVKEGAKVEDIIEEMELLESRIDECIVLDTLKYLVRGGRIGKLQFFLGNLLSIKPVVRFDEKGMHDLLAKVRTHQQALDFTIKRIKEKIAPFKTNTIDVVIEDIINREWSDKVKEVLQKNFNCREIFQFPISAVVGTHVGPGGWAVTFYPVTDAKI